MSTLMSAATLAAPLAAGWGAHTLVWRRRLDRARRDPLTGLHTRHGWTLRAERIIARPGAVVLLVDLDRFKQINDTFGHAAGDAVLVTTAERLAHWCGDTGAAGRLGGDEFAAVATSPRGTVPQLRAALAEPVSVDGQLVPTSASVGMARVADLPVPVLSAALEAADRSMYAAKGTPGRRGGDR
ncbi:GGDEF domain-containing protein [Streptomyces sp. DH37]|uniref:GGDEF domain-containing protein n=1 Tax=Streptomyces sp. DH37 TaxID=3040122 RepID=UPI0030145750